MIAHQPYPTKVLVAGATGRVGVQLVARLQHIGVGCRVLVRNPALGAKLGHVEVVEGNALSVSDCHAAVEGCDAVICTLGDYKIPKDRPLVDDVGVINVADAAAAVEARRFVLVSSLGSGDTWEWLPFPAKAYFHLLRERPILQAKTRSDAHVRSLDLDWTILWPAYLTNRPMRAEPILTSEGRAGGTSSRQAVADTAVRCLASPGAVGRGIIVVDPFMRFTLTGGRQFELDVPWEPWSKES